MADTQVPRMPPADGAAMDISKTDKEVLERNAPPSPTPPGDSSEGLVEEKKSETQLTLEKALAVMAEKNKPEKLSSSVKTINKMLKTLQKKPTDKDARRIPTKNIIFKKFITDVEGAMEFMRAVGWQVSEEGEGAKRQEYFQILPDKVNVDTLELANKLLAVKLEDISEKSKAQAVAPPPKRTNCKGAGCGFFGDEANEGFCSGCFKKHVLPGVGAKGKPLAAPVVEPATPQKCIGAACSFFGAAKFQGYCSVCHKKVTAEKATRRKKHIHMAKLKLRAMFRFNLGRKNKTQKNRTRCWQCKRKVGITGIECRCGYIFCGTHRYADQHECAFDHKQNHQKKLRAENKVVMADKFEKMEEG